MVTAAKLWVEEQNESRPERAARARAARGRRARRKMLNGDENLERVKALLRWG